MTTLEWAVALPPAPCTGPCLVATPALEPGAEPEPWSQTLSSTGQHWAAELGVSHARGRSCGQRGGRGLQREGQHGGPTLGAPMGEHSQVAIHSARSLENLNKVLTGSLPEIVSGKKVPGLQLLSFITSDPHRLINLELFHSGVVPKQLG